MNTLIGCDQELFLKNDLGRPISAVGLIGGTKKEPRDIGNGCAVQEDNVAVEFCIPPTNEVSKFIASINYNLNYITEFVREKGLSLSIVAATEFGREELQSEQSKTFGCDPDYNAWTMRPNPRPQSKNPYLRSAGGHIHVSTDKHPFLVSRSMDLFLGVPSILLEENSLRRELYGKAGACRPKPYGVEYRALSNFWLASDELKEWVFEQTQRAVRFADSWLDDEADTIQQCVNNSDKDVAKKLMNKYQI